MDRRGRNLSAHEREVNQMADKLRWGIIGTGNIARQFAEGVAGAKRSVISAVASRRQETANAFAGQHAIPNAYGDYAKLLDDPAVEAVYISLPNSLHCQWTIRALQAGKHVLCEKPFAMNLDEAQRMFAAAEAADRLLMEAFMYRCHPLITAVRDAVRSGEIGRLQIIRTSFCYRTRTIEGNVRFVPELGGGALMDIGCYCIDFSRLFAGGEPETVLAVGHRHETGVDDLVVGSMRFGNGILAGFTCGMSAQADNTAYLLGDEGYIQIPIPWKPPVKQAEFTIARGTPPRMDQKSASAASVKPASPPQRRITIDAPVPLYALEADAFAAAVLDGAPLPVTRQDTLGNMKVIDQMLAQI